MTVTGTVAPSSVKTRVMPHLRPMTPMGISSILSRRRGLPALRRTADGDPQGKLPGGLAGRAKEPESLYQLDGSVQFDLYVDPRRQLQLHERVDRLVRRVDDVHE